MFHKPNPNSFVGDFYTDEVEIEPETLQMESFRILNDFRKDSWLWLKDVVDMHAYPLPCVDMRLYDEFELARQMRWFGYKGFVAKRHYCCNADVATLVNKYVKGITCIGSIVLNDCVGGLNPNAVDFAILMGAKYIWMGNRHAGTLSNEPFHSRYNWHNRPSDHYTVTRPVKKWEVHSPINAIDLDTGKVIQEVKDIIELCREAEDVVLNSCHISMKECFAVAKECEKQDFHKFVIDHSTGKEIEDLKKLTALGAYLEFDVPNSEPQQIEMGKKIKEIGPKHCVVTSGHGAVTHPHPIEVMRWGMASLRRAGLTKQEIDLMTKITPAKLLELDEKPRWKNRPFI